MANKAYSIDAKPRGAPVDQWRQIKRFRPKGSVKRQWNKAYATMDDSRTHQARFNNAPGRSMGQLGSTDTTKNVYRVRYEAAQLVDRLLA